MSRKIRLGILFGGRSGEHEVSLQSAASVLRAIDPGKYNVIPIGISKEGRWMLGQPLKGDAAAALPTVFRYGTPVTASADPAGPALIPLNSSLASVKKLRPEIDVAFPLLHGTFGEDGTIQGLFELAGIPYVGSGVLASATGMDKDVTKRLFRDAGLPVVEWVLVLRSEWESHSQKIRKLAEREIGYPAFVKPANLGSSVGITKVHGSVELGPAIDRAARYDRKILVEKSIDGREIECAILGNDHPEASQPGEIVPVNEFYDYDAKYVQEGSKLIVPAKLLPHKARETQQLALRAFKAIDGAGMARVDFLMQRATAQLFVNEINTIPGFTSISMYPKLWEASSVPYTKLIDRLIELALERHREKGRNRYTYERV